ncbi:FimB/Mfa2 family fimbrial subunit, partial [Phocaeicola vulgatus]|uniref:FimB/Mfa2 family fimbrial subunit n=1 Tax=Phocaeicola vulgatus TaxID=821 RepID=UPI002108875F
MHEIANLEDILVVHAGMITLRLMENDDTRLRLIYLPSGKEIFDIPLTPYL